MQATAHQHHAGYSSSMHTMQATAHPRHAGLQLIHTMQATAHPQLGNIYNIINNQATSHPIDLILLVLNQVPAKRGQPGHFQIREVDSRVRILLGYQPILLMKVQNYATTIKKRKELGNQGHWFPQCVQMSTSHLAHK